MNIESAKKLIKDVNSKIDSWDERSQFKLKGVGNLSRSDMDELIMYAELYIRNGGNFNGLMGPLGGVKEVLDAYGLKDPSNDFGW